MIVDSVLAKDSRLVRDAFGTPTSTAPAALASERCPARLAAEPNREPVAAWSAKRSIGPGGTGHGRVGTDSGSGTAAACAPAGPRAHCCQAAWRARASDSAPARCPASTNRLDPPRPRASATALPRVITMSARDGPSCPSNALRSRGWASTKANTALNASGAWGRGSTLPATATVQPARSPASCSAAAKTGSRSLGWSTWRFHVSVAVPSADSASATSAINVATSSSSEANPTRRWPVTALTHHHRTPSNSPRRAFSARASPAPAPLVSPRTSMSALVVSAESRWLTTRR